MISTLEAYHPEDWQLTLADIPDSPFKGDPAQYDQQLVDAYSCFVIGPISCVSDVYGTRVSQKDINDTWEKIKAEGKFTPGVGGKFVDGVDAARHIHNRLFPDRKVSSYRIPFDGPIMRKCMNAGYSAVIGERLNSEDIKDIKEDGILNNDSVGSGSCGHCVKVRKFYGVIDNYPNKPGFPNIYKLDDLQKKFDNGKVFKYSYVFLPSK